MTTVYTSDKMELTVTVLPSRLVWWLLFLGMLWS